MLAVRGRLGAGALAARSSVRCHRCLGRVVEHPPALYAGAVHRLGGTRGLAGGFFDELKKSFRKEAEQNKEFQESLRRLRKDTDDLTGKATEGSTKITSEAAKMAEGVTSKLSEATSKWTASLSDLKAKLATAKAEAEAAAKEEATVSSTATQEAQAPPSEAPPAKEAWQEERAKKAAEMAEARRLRKEQEAQQQAAAEEARQAGQQEQATGDKEEAGEAGKEKKEGQADEGASSLPPPPGAKWVSYDATLGLRVMGKPVGVLLSEGKTELREAWDDLFGLKETSPATGMRKQLFKPAREAAEEAEEAEGEGAEKKKKEEVKGGGALVIVKDQGSAWQRLADKLRDAPIIQDILNAGGKLADTELGRQASKLRTGLKDRVEDVREVWETSQNPLVYKLSSMWDNLTSETELGLALREIRRADPEFVVEDWVRDISDNFLPSFFESYLRGDLKTLQPYLSEGMYRSLAEEFRLRKAEGLALDPNVLEIGNTEVIQAKMHDHQPVLMVGTLIQHINCVRNREGTIVEGTDDEVRASFYLLLFAREFNEEEGALVWKITERYLGFSEKYI